MFVRLIVLVSLDVFVNLVILVITVITVIILIMLIIIVILINLFILVTLIYVKKKKKNPIVWRIILSEKYIAKNKILVCVK